MSSSPAAEAQFDGHPDRVVDRRADINPLLTALDGFIESAKHGQLDVHHVRRVETLARKIKARHRQLETAGPVADLLGIARDQRTAGAEVTTGTGDDHART